MREQERNREQQSAGTSPPRSGQKGAHTSPRRSSEQDSPEPERPVTPAEEAGQSIPELEDPPQAEGPREDD